MWIGIDAHQFQTIDGLLTPIQIGQHVPAFHPLGHHAAFEQPRGHAFNPQDIRVVHPPGYNHLFAVFLEFQVSGGHPVRIF